MLFDRLSAPLAGTDCIINLPDLDEVLDRDPLTVTPQTLVSEAIAQMGQTYESQCHLAADDSFSTEPSPSLKRSCCVLVVEGSRPVGILTERDVVQISIAETDLSRVTLAQVMTQPLVTLTLSPLSTLFFALGLLRQHQIRHLPVVDDQGQLLGLLTHDRICRVLQPAHLLKLRQVAELMTETVIQAAPTASVLSIAQQMVKHRQSCVVVVEPLATEPQTIIPLGIVTERDIVQFQRLRLNFAKTEAQTVMSAPLFCLKPIDSLWLAHQEMQRRRVRRLVVAGEQGELRGILTQTSLLGVFDPVQMASVIEVLQQQLELRTQELVRTTQQLEQEMVERQQINATLQQSQQQLQTIFNQTFQFIELLRPDGTLLDANHASLEFVGASLTEVVGQPFWKTPWWTHAPEQQQRLQAAIAQAALGQFVRCEFTHRSARGTIETFDFSIKPILSEAGQVISLVVEERNIEDRKQIEQQLQAAYAELERLVADRTHELIEAEEQFRILASSVPVGIYLTDAAGDCVFVNHRWLEIAGLSFAQAMGKGWAKALHPADREQVFSKWYEVVQTGREFFSEFRFQTPLGRVNWLLSSAAAIRDQTGIITGYLGVIADITERKQAQEKISEQAALLDVTTDAIFVRSLDNRILYWNQGAEKLYGWSVTAAIGKNAEELVQTEATQLKAATMATLEQGSWQGELHQTTKTGKVAIVDSRWLIISNYAGEPQSILTVNTDITEKKQLEAQFLRTQRLESIGTLASGMAHDLSNILTPILAIAQLLPHKLRQSDESMQHLLEILAINAKRGGDLVKQVLSFARGTEEQCTTLQVGHLLAEVTKIAQQTFPKSIEISTQVSTKELWLVRADATQLHQAIVNLCVNARDAMPKGGRLTIAAENFAIDQTFARMHLDAQVGPYVKITIADTGTGITLDVCDRMFDPFFTTKEQGKGTGLGLPTVLTIVKKHGGFIDVATKVGCGTSFTVYLPALENSEPPLITASDSLAGNGELILVVDDEVTIGETIKATLETHNYRALVVPDGIAAISLYIQHQQEIRLVLLDLIMPSLDGVKLIATLSKLNPQVPIIVMSGIDTNEEKASARARVQASLAKPFTTPDLLTAIDLVLKRSLLNPPSQGSSLKQ